MKCFFYSFFVYISLFSCHRKTVAQAPVAILDIPICIQQKIDSIKQQPVWSPPAEIDEYLYKDKKVYVVSARCCDFFSTAIDSNCAYVCAPSGGFTGKGDLKCKDFLDNAKLTRQVWKDDRQKE